MKKTKSHRRIQTNGSTHCEINVSRHCIRRHLCLSFIFVLLLLRPNFYLAFLSFSSACYRHHLEISPEIRAIDGEAGDEWSGGCDVLVKIYKRPKILHFFIFELFEGIKIIIFSVLWPRWPLWKPLRTKLSPLLNPIWPSDLLVRYEHFDFQEEEKRDASMHSFHFKVETNNLILERIGDAHGLHSRGDDLDLQRPVRGGRQEEKRQQGWGCRAVRYAHPQIRTAALHFTASNQNV